MTVSSILCTSTLEELETLQTVPNRWAYFVLMLLSSIGHPVILPYLAHLAERGSCWAERVRVLFLRQTEDCKFVFAQKKHMMKLLNCKKTVLFWAWSNMLFLICFECMNAMTWRLKTNSVHMLCICSCTAFIYSLSLLTQWVSVSEVCLYSSHFTLSGSSCTHYKPADSN